MISKVGKKEKLYVDETLDNSLLLQTGSKKTANVKPIRESALWLEKLMQLSFTQINYDRKFWKRFFS